MMTGLEPPDLREVVRDTFAPARRAVHNWAIVLPFVLVNVGSAFFNGVAEAVLTTVGPVASYGSSGTVDA